MDVNELEDTPHGGSLFNGQSHVLYWADVSSEIAFVVPTPDNKHAACNNGQHNDCGNDQCRPFYSWSFESIQKAAYEKGLDPIIVRWLTTILQSGLTTARLGEERVIITSTRKCPQGGVLSPLLCSMVVDNLLDLLTSNGS